MSHLLTTLQPSLLLSCLHQIRPHRLSQMSHLLTTLQTPLLLSCLPQTPSLHPSRPPLSLLPQLSPGAATMSQLSLLSLKLASLYLPRDRTSRISSTRQLTRNQSDQSRYAHLW